MHFMLIKYKLLVNTAILVLAMLIMLGIVNYTINSLQGDITVDRQISTVDVLVLQLRRNEKDFLARKELKYVDKFETNFKKLEISLNELEKSFLQMDSQLVEIAQLKQTLVEYHQHFNNIVKLQQHIGLNRKDGLYGELRAAVHQVEDLIGSYDYELLSLVLQLRRNEKDFMLRLDEKYLDKWEKNSTVLLSSVKSSDLQPQLIEQIKVALSDYQLAFTNLVKAQRELGFSADKGSNGKMRDAIHKVDKVLGVLLAKSMKNVKEHIMFVNLTAYSVFFIISIIAFIFAAYISRSILKAINRLKNTMNEIAKSKDLSIICNSNSNDEISEMADVFNRMISSFRQLIIKVHDSVDTINNVTDSLAKNIQSANDGVNSQIQQTDLVATAVTEMVATVDEIGNNTNEAANKAQVTYRNAEMGKSKVDTTIVHIDQLSSKLLESESIVDELATDSDTIGSVLDVIRGIAEQTNLLALNAAIEAARAGEQGRGFAVVADEVRTLASRTQDSTQEIEAIISSLQSRTKQIVAHMSDCRIQGQNSAAQAGSAGQMLELITTDASTIMEMSSAIALSIKEQVVVANDVNENVVMIRDVAGQTAESARQNKQTSEELMFQANILNKEVNSFSV